MARKENRELIREIDRKLHAVNCQIEQIKKGEGTWVGTDPDWVYREKAGLEQERKKLEEE